MNAADKARAQQHTYRLLGQVYLKGITAATLPFLRAIPPLQAQVPAQPDFDELAARHYQMFGLNIFPYESIFLGVSGLLGGSFTDQVAEHYRHSGFRVEDANSGQDHVGNELDFLAFLCGLESEALGGGRASAAAAARNDQWHFMQLHLLRWLLPFTLAVQRQRDPFYSAVAALTVELIHDHLSALPDPGVLGEPLLPDPPDLLAQQETGLKEIAAFLITPPFSGFFLSRDGVAQMARAHELPRGFGSRRQMLQNTLEAAAQYETVPALLETLRAYAHWWQDHYATTVARHPALASFAAAWEARSSATEALLVTMRARLTAAG